MFVKLKDLLKGIDAKVVGTKEVEIARICSDSRIARPKDLFIAKKGSSQDGIDFIEEAISAGVSAIVTYLYNPFIKKTQIIVEDPGALEPILAARFYKDPSKDLFVVGVTGSKGKTTTCYLIHYLLEKIGKSCGLMTTVEIRVKDRKENSSLTTHDAISNQRWLKEMLDQGASSAVIEVSSHGLDQCRVDAIQFDLAVFTNLYPDHLDYHQTMEAYALAKKKLFDKAPFSIYNADSPWTDFMKGDKKGWTFGIENEAADIRAQNVIETKEGLSFSIENVSFSTNLMGSFNLFNLLAAISVGRYLGVSLEELSSIFHKVPPIPGRLEKIENRLGIETYVDYAHTGEALDQLLSFLRPLCEKRIIVVFGAGGQRDPHRRKEMGKAANRWADLVIVTSDNPRNEDPHQICQEICQEIAKEKTIVEIDREKAIFLAITEAKKGDLVLIAGKGHEKMQLFQHHRIHFDDVEMAQKYLQKKESLQQ